MIDNRHELSSQRAGPALYDEFLLIQALIEDLDAKPLC